MDPSEVCSFSGEPPPPIEFNCCFLEKISNLVEITKQGSVTKQDNQFVSEESMKNIFSIWILPIKTQHKADW